MPHLTLEYSGNIKEKKHHFLFRRLHRILAKIAKADLATCQSRLILQKLFYIGNGEPKNAFVHLKILLAEGRSSRVKKQIGQMSLEALERHFSRSLEELNLQISVQVIEFPMEFYFKIPKEMV